MVKIGQVAASSFISRPESPGRWPRLGARAALLAGFGAMLAIAGAGGVDMWLTLRNIQVRSSEVLNDYLRRAAILERARTDVYLSTTFLRDFVLDPDPSHAQTHLDGLRASRRGLDDAVAEYAALVDNGERATFDEFVAAVHRYWIDMDPVFTWTPDQRRREGFQFLASRILPQRAHFLEQTDAIASINEQELRHRRQLLDAVYAQARWRLGLVAGLALALGCLVAALGSAYMARLEARARSSFEEVVRAQQELERLSQRLVEAQEQERRALSRELHDEVGQSLSALLVDLGNAAAATPPGYPEIAARHLSMRKLAEQSLGVIRNMALLLRPSMLDDLGLAPALEWQAREMSRRTGVAVEVEAAGVPDELPEAIRTCVYRVVQEALNNAQRHASAQRIEIVLRQDRDRLLALIRDDGRGFDPHSHRGAGLIGMEERVRALGGALRIDSSPGRGCVVQVELPAGVPVAAS